MRDRCHADRIDTVGRSRLHDEGLIGEQKFLATDRVIVRPGTANQIAIIKWIFEEFLKGKSQKAIVRELNLRGVLTNRGRPWSGRMIGALLRNEAYVGNLVWNRVDQKLGRKKDQ